MFLDKPDPHPCWTSQTIFNTVGDSYINSSLAHSSRSTTMTHRLVIINYRCPHSNSFLSIKMTRIIKPSMLCSTIDYRIRISTVTIVKIYLTPFYDVTYDEFFPILTVLPHAKSNLLPALTFSLHIVAFLPPLHAP